MKNRVGVELCYWKMSIVMLLLISFGGVISSSAHEGSNISDSSLGSHFLDRTFRYDFYLLGDAESLTVAPAQMKFEGEWNGKQTVFIDTLNFGNLRFSIYDKESGEKLYAQGFNPLFLEWQTTAEAKMRKQAYYNGVRFPSPKAPFRIEFQKRAFSGEYVTIFEDIVDPQSYFIIEEEVPPYPITNIIHSGSAKEKVDLAIIAEGYTEGEMEIFVADAERMVEALFSTEPFSSYRDMFNIYAVHSPSMESGTDIPTEGIFRNTIMNSSFSTFDVDRYLTTTDMKSVYDIAAAVPWDHVYVLVNSDTYGGGGFYNFCSLSTSDNRLSEKVFIHEFGHGFAGLADEYYNSEVAYEDYYNLEVEPWEPNITTRVEFHKKWESMIDSITPQPTPRTAQYSDVVGLFEGGGYMTEGIYSPVMDCRMKSNNPDSFCPVCIKAIADVIKQYTGK